MLNRRSFLAATGAGALAIGLPRSLAKPSHERPNIVLCMADDQGWGDVAYNGHPALKTPNLDAMAASGLRFDRFYAAAPLCSPTRASVLTGRHPNRMGCFKWGYTLRPQEVTLAEALQQAGYVTGHFGKWHLGSVYKGSPVNPGASGFDEWVSALNFYDMNPIFSRAGRAEQHQGESSQTTAGAAIEFIRKHAKGDKPFLAVVWFSAPHGPHEATAADRKRYAGSPKKLRDFYGEITALDRAVEQVRDALRELEVAENTLVWYCSDNGGLPKIGRNGGRGGKGDIHEGGLRVPAIIEWPARINAPLTTGAACVTSDIYPTVLEAAGVTVENQPILDGISLMPLIQGDGRDWARSIGFWNYDAKCKGDSNTQWMGELLKAQQEGHEPAYLERLHLDAGDITTKLTPDTGRGHAAWNTWPWKLHRMEDDTGKVTFKLYNLHDDPMEENDRLADEPELAGSMQIPLAAWQASVVRSHNGEDY
jgi:arylsulfatase A-like enzyme